MAEIGVQQVTLFQVAVVDLVRAGGVSILCLCLVYPFRNLISSSLRSGKVRFLILALIPVFTPPLLIGYVYSNLSYRISDMTGLRLFMYLTILLCRYLPVSVLLFTFVPSPVSEQGLFCADLLRKDRNGFSRIFGKMIFRLRSDLFRILSAFTLTTLMVFTEFEIASLLTVQTWTVVLFDSLAGGVSRKTALYSSLVPVCIQVLLILPVLLMLNKGGRGTQITDPCSADRRKYAATLLLFCCVGSSVFPLLYICADAGRGVAGLKTHGGFAENIILSLLIAVTVTTILYVFSGLIYSAIRNHSSKKVSTAVILISLPGLFGTLILSLTGIAVFRLPVLDLLYDSFIPLLTVLSVSFIPFALILTFICRTGEYRLGLYTALLLGKGSKDSEQGKQAGRIAGSIRFRTGVIVWLFLFLWVYFEIQASALLTPPGTATVFVLLYNLMHYGRSPVLSALSLIAFAIPFVLFIVLFHTRYYSQKEGRYERSALAN